MDILVVTCASTDSVLRLCLCFKLGRLASEPCAFNNVRLDFISMGGF
jgi:hypothetical protein